MEATGHTIVILIDRPFFLEGRFLGFREMGFTLVFLICPLSPGVAAPEREAEYNRAQ